MGKKYLSILQRERKRKFARKDGVANSKLEPRLEHTANKRHKRSGPQLKKRESGPSSAFIKGNVKDIDSLTPSKPGMSEKVLSTHGDCCVCATRLLLQVCISFQFMREQASRYRFVKRALLRHANDLNSKGRHL